jgi:hypothetical protein
MENSQSARAESEDDLIKKRSYGGSCDLRLNPSRNSVPECETPWPRSIPAPETCFSLVYYFRCRARYERFKNPACHTCSRRFFFYITPHRRVQGLVDEVGSDLPIWNCPQAGCDMRHRLESATQSLLSEGIREGSGNSSSAALRAKGLSPVWRLLVIAADPQLALWAALFRRSAAEVCRCTRQAISRVMRFFRQTPLFADGQHSC